jgi:hypothetical protein
MTDMILCVTALFFLGWVLVLKAEITNLKNELEKVKSLLKTKLGQIGAPVEVTQGRRAKSN